MPEAIAAPPAGEGGVLRSTGARFAGGEATHSASLAAMAQHTVPRDRRYPPGAVILCEETGGAHLYIVKRGRVRVVKRGRRGDVELGTLGPGNLFGEMALIDRRVRSASVIAIEETVCIELPYQLVTGLVEHANPWIAAILRILVLRLRCADEALAGTRGVDGSGETPVDQVTERHLRRIVKRLEETDQIAWERLGADSRGP